MEMVIVKPVYVNAYPIMSMHQIVHTMDVSTLIDFNWYLGVANKRWFFFLSLNYSFQDSCHDWK